MKTASMVASNFRSRMAWLVLVLILAANGAIGSTLVAWGTGYWGQTNTPPGLTDAIAVSAGQYHVLALRANGTVIAWGGDGSDYLEVNQVPPDLDNVKAISAGTALSVALRFDGTVVAWGHDGPDGYTNAPAGLNDAVAIAAGGYHGLALRANGRVIGWGQSMAGQITPPFDLTNAIAVAAGSHHSLALRANGTVVAFGHGDQGQINVPPGLSNVVAIAAVDTRSFALKFDGTVVQWGSNSGGEFAPPPGLSNVVAIAAGYGHTLALRRDGSVVAWGDDEVATVPSGLSNVVAIAANNYVNLALIGPLPAPPLILRGATWRYNDTGVDQGTAWRTPGFADRAWPEGRAQLGFGDGDEATLLRRQPTNGTPIATAYFRRAFVVTNAGAFTNLALRLLYDDGAVVYVNGVESFRVNLPAGPVAYGTFAGAVAPDNSITTVDLNPALLVNGTNVVAVEVHQVNIASSDLSFDLELTAAGSVSPPGIAQQPASQTAPAGGTVTFNVEATGTAPLSYQWFFEGNALTGATNASLVLGNVSFAQAGSYEVEVSSPYGRVRSDAAQLAVLPRPSAPGSVDFTFDPTAGGERVGLTGGTPYVNAVLPQPDGKVLIGGWFNGVNGVLRNNLARLNADGTLDANFQPDFGVDGAVSDLALQPDGKVIVIGSFSAVNAQPHPLIARLNADGSVDDTFNCRLAGDLHLRLDGLAVQSNGQIWIGGRFTHVNGVARANLARLNADGSLDTSFDPQSAVPGTNAAIHRIRLQADGKLLISGTWAEPQRSLVRLNADGSLDRNFTLVAASPSGYYEYIYDMASHSDGTITIVGTFESVNGVPRRCAARLRADGTVDAGFNPDFGRWATAAGSVVVQPDGKVIVGGWFSEVSGVPRAGLARLTTNGSLDPSFDSANVIGRPPGTGYQPSVQALALLSDGRVLVGAHPHWLHDNTHSVFRLDTQGRRDSGFTTVVQAPIDGVINLALQPDGKMIVGVVGDSAGLGWSSLLRLNPNGLVDESFRPDTNVLWMNALAVQPDGKILVNSTCREYSEECPSLVRFLADGSVDASFRAPRISGFDQGIETFTFQPDGKILVGGLLLEAGGLPYGGIVRLHADGRLDTGFRPVPITVGDDVGGGVEHILVLPGGKFLIAGGFTWDTGNYAPAALALLYADGTLDSNFLANIPAFEFVGSVALQANGKFLVSGTLMGAGGARWEDFVRLNADGTLDPTFQPEVPGEVGSMVVQADGRILALSRAVPNGIVRLHPDGALDTTFQAPAGLVTEAYWNAANRLILQADGQLLVSGAFHSVNGIPTHGIVRLNNDVAPSFVRRVIGGEMIQLMAYLPASVTVYAVEDRPPPGWQLMSISHGGTFDPLTGKVKFGPFYDRLPRTLTYWVTPPVDFTGVAWFTGVASTDGLNIPISGIDHIVIAAPHPADSAPTNWSLSIGEVTAYAAAWRRGQLWPIGPNPIPMDYMTRAGALWRVGECYRSDSQITNAPLWWVSCLLSNAPAGLTPATAPLIAVSSITRILPGAFALGAPLPVTLEVTPESTVGAYAVEEHLPPGWTAINIGEGGELDTIGGTVRWGPFFGSGAQSLTYEALPSPGAPASATFSGSASFDGVSLATDGASLIHAAGRLNLSRFETGCAGCFSISGQPGQRFVIEASTDLQTWVPLSVITIGTGTTEFIDPVAGEFGQRFYRAHEEH